MKKEAEKPESGGISNTPAQRTERNGKIRTLLDWVGFTFLNEETTLDTVLRVFYDHLDIDFVHWRTGRRNFQGYASSLNFENINIYWDGAENQGIHVDITGQGCRYIETIYKKLGVQQLNPTQFYWFDFIKLVYGMGAKFTRLDVAIDDFSQYFSVPYIFQKCLLGELTMKFKSWSPDGYFGADGKAKGGMTLYFGSDMSRFQICMYEKGKQLELDDDVNWTRTELRYRHERAVEMIQIMLANDAMYKEYSIGVIAAGHLKDYLTFRDTNPNDSNKRRWKVSSFWDEFLEGIEPLKLTSALPDRSIQKTASWFKNQVSKAFVMMYLAYDGINDDWVENMQKAGLKKIRQRDLDIVDEYRRLFDKSHIMRLDSAIDAKKRTAADNSDPITYKALT